MARLQLSSADDCAFALMQTNLAWAFAVLNIPNQGLLTAILDELPSYTHVSLLLSSILRAAFKEGLLVHFSIIRQDFQSPRPKLQTHSAP